MGSTAGHRPVCRSEDLHLAHTAVGGHNVVHATEGNHSLVGENKGLCPVALTSWSA